MVSLLSRTLRIGVNCLQRGQFLNVLPNLCEDSVSRSLHEGATSRSLRIGVNVLQRRHYVNMQPNLPEGAASRSLRVGVNILQRRHYVNVLPNLREDADLRGKKGLILGVFNSDEEPNKLSDTAKEFDTKNSHVLCEFLESLTSPMTLGQSMVFTNVDPDFFNVCLVGVGSHMAGYNRVEELDQCKENVRIATGIGARRIKETGVTCIMVDGLSDEGAAAEGANLGIWRYQEFKAEENQVPVANVDMYGEGDREEWERGITKSNCQNMARHLTDTPANCMTPKMFCQAAADILCPCGVQIEVRDHDWMEAKKMNGILTVARGSCEPPALLEIGYCGGPIDDKPVLLIGKGTTFNAGGITQWVCENMDEMRGDMSGAAVIVAVIRAAASLSLPINIRGVIPLLENLPSGMAVKPGDIVHTMAKKTVMIQDTGREGMLPIADAMTYGQAEYKPKLVIDVATLSKGQKDCFGSGVSAVFTTDDEIWAEIQKAGSLTGDRVWRLPLWQHFTDKVTTYSESDLSNVGKGVGGSSCTGAAFLKEFIYCTDWIHIDTTGTGMLSYGEEIPYLPKGRMTGRPTRTLFQFLYQTACGAEISAAEEALAKSSSNVHSR